MLQLKNTSPFAPAFTVLPDQNAVDTLYIVVKGTFTVHPRLAVAAQPVPPVLTDEYWGDPATSSLKYASELHIGKAATDVVLVGQAWAPRGRAVAATEVSVSVAGRHKIVRVSGDRVWKSGGGFTAPEPFVQMPLVYERAFGGSQAVAEDGSLLAEERNPVGVGFLGKRSRGEMTGQKLPNLEDPRRLLERPGDTPPPAAFGAVAPSWLPRRRFAGTYDDAWKQQRAPYLPADFNLRFFNVAPPDLTFDRFLSGGEEVQLLGVSPHGPLRFALPSCRPHAEVRIAGAHETPRFELETILIDSDENRICLSWRARLACDRKVLKVETVTIGVEGLDLPMAV